MIYEQWNLKLKDYFFNTDVAGREVILFANHDLINQIGILHNSDYYDFLQAIRKGPACSNKKTLPQKAYDTYEQFKGLKTYPRYIAYLVFFVLAAGTEGDFSGNAYYPRINQLLGDALNPITSANFQRMHELWEALEEWTKDDMMESLGRFTARIRGNWKHVGMPWSQTLLTSEERGNLPFLFAEYGFDPTSPPAENVIARALIQSGGILARTKRVMQNQDSGEGGFRQAVLDLVLSDLQDWAGVVPSRPDAQGESGNTRICGSLRICLDYDDVARTVQTTVRSKANRELPEDEMCFTRLRDRSVWSCTSSAESWTSEFYDPSSRWVFDASALDWLNGEAFTDETGQWRVQLKPGDVRLFAFGPKEGLPKWVETNRLQAGERYLLAASARRADEVSKWGTESCEKYEELPVSEGMPTGWRLFEIYNVEKSHSSIDMLQLSSSVSVIFVGGIKTRPGNKFFPFALPKIAVEGISGSYKVIISGKVLDKGGDGLWSFPDDLPRDQPLLVEVVSKTVVCKRSFQTEESALEQEYPGIIRDRFGMVQESADPYCIISGVSVAGDIVSKIPPFTSFLPTYLSNRITFLGSTPGEIVKWPADGLPKGWEPIWALIKIRRDKYQAFYVGSSYHTPEIRAERRTPLLKKWREAFTYLDATPPRLRSLIALWNAYKKEARKL